ncbi:MAG: pyruvate carboxylase [Alphaproteobacteria bacterium]|nr:pyruvate carboxylase [Alphaproteobacteria bacterium]
MRKFKKILVANRSEIAIRVFRAATELGLRTVAIYSHEDRFALHRFKADEAYLVGEGKGPVQAYLDIPDIIRIAKDAHVDAIHPGYGFLSENPDFAEACADAGVTFIGPTPQVMRDMGDKVAARAMAARANIPMVPATGALPLDQPAKIRELAAEIGYPVMLKASWGGGGRGMRAVQSEKELLEHVAAGSREAAAAFGNGEVFLEKMVERAKHIEVQILGDQHGNVVHLFERECSMQRRNQKVVERAPAAYLTAKQREALCASAVRLAKSVNYVAAGTVEFLMDADSGKFYFMEVNPRIQVEHTVTEVVTGIDLVQAQIRVCEGMKIGAKDSVVPRQEDIRLNGHALQCRITTENPANNFTPDYGRLTNYRGATGFGIRLDGGTAFSGAIITPFYDSMLEKVTAWAPTPAEVTARMLRAIREFRIRGVKTNLQFLEGLIGNPRFTAWDYTTRFIDTTPELFKFAPRRDRATRILAFLGDVIVNGNPEVVGRIEPGPQPVPPVPKSGPDRTAPGTKQLLEKLGPEAFATWMRKEKRLLITDTTLRDAHQSLLATRMRSYDMYRIAPFYTRALPELFSVECWGGATFDVAMRFLKEDPWDRLVTLRRLLPNTLLQMLLRSSNAVGYTNYPDNIVEHFVATAAEAGIDVFRVFDSLNWVENMHVAIDAVLETGKLCEAAICYTGDLTDPKEKKYTLDYYIKLARNLEKAGAHILAIKDMAGLCKPAAARELVSALKAEVKIPLHFHTHDTSGIAAASVLAAADAGVDAVDAAVDSMSGLTSQPNLGSIVEALRSSPRDTGLDHGALRSIAHYWEGVRRYYRPFESDLRSGMAEVYDHAMPGGQYTNLREQVRALGIAETRWPEVAQAYAQVNDLFGNIVKVTPSSKVVGDMAIFMVTNGLTPNQVTDPSHAIDFPQSVIEFFRGDLGQPYGGFPKELQKKVLKGEKPLIARPGRSLKAVDLKAKRAELEAKYHRTINDQWLSSYLMYPKVFTAYMEQRTKFSDISFLPTPAFFYGLEGDEELSLEIEKGKTLIIRFFTVGDADEHGNRSVFFELNGQPRTVSIADRKLAATIAVHRKAEDGNANHVAAPMPGLVARVGVKAGDRVKAGDLLLTIEAMKMETAIHADKAAKVVEIVVPAGNRVEAKDLLVVLDPA